MRKLYHRFLSPDRAFAARVYRISGERPREPEIYKLAFTHSSTVREGNSAEYSNERLEYLGDAILGAVVAEYLYNRYPRRAEGFLTEMRSRLVNRQTLNDFAVRLGLNQLLERNQRAGQLNRTAYGNALEAFIGALYLDLGYGAAKRFILKRMLASLANLEQIEQTENNFKSRLMEYVQKHKLDVQFEVVSEINQGNQRSFTVAVRVNGEIKGQGTDYKKKFAEQKAAELAMATLTAERT